MKKAKSFLTFVYTWTNRLKKSTTIKFNALMIAASQLIDPLSEALPTMREFLTPEMYKWIFLSIAIANILLRFKTNKALAAK